MRRRDRTTAGLPDGEGKARGEYRERVPTISRPADPQWSRAVRDGRHADAALGSSLRSGWVGDSPSPGKGASQPLDSPSPFYPPLASHHSESFPAALAGLVEATALAEVGGEAEPNRSPLRRAGPGAPPSAGMMLSGRVRPRQRSCLRGAILLREPARKFGLSGRRFPAYALPSMQFLAKCVALTSGRFPAFRSLITSKFIEVCSDPPVSRCRTAELSGRLMARGTGPRCWRELPLVALFHRGPDQGARQRVAVLDRIQARCLATVPRRLSCVVLFLIGVIERPLQRCSPFPSPS